LITLVQAGVSLSHPESAVATAGCICLNDNALASRHRWAVVIYLASVCLESVSLGERASERALTDRLSAHRDALHCAFMNKISQLAAINNAAPHISASFFSKRIPLTTT
jgi:hypothetical protein